jgi:hypothetical protein
MSSSLNNNAIRAMEHIPNRRHRLPVFKKIKQTKNASTTGSNERRKKLKKYTR